MSDPGDADVRDLAGRLVRGVVATVLGIATSVLTFALIPYHGHIRVDFFGLLFACFRVEYWFGVQNEYPLLIAVGACLLSFAFNAGLAALVRARRRAAIAPKLPRARVVRRALLGSCCLIVACAHPRPAHRTPADDLATQLVAWDVVRQRAESSLLAIPLPRIAVRADPAVVAVPSLSPHFATVAMAWPTICERRGALPDDVFEYAMAWCRAARDGKGDLERVLAGLVSSSVSGLRAAAVDDLVNVVADAHDAATAMRILDRIALPPGTLDQLAAIYSGLGRADDEAAVRSQLPAPPRCPELDRALDPFVPQSLTTIRNSVVASDGSAVPSTACAALARSLLCRIGAVSEPEAHDPTCAGAEADDREVREAHYLAAYAHWGTDWLAVVDHAVQAMPEPGAEQVAIAALSASLRSGCEPARLRDVHGRADSLLREPAHDARWTATLQSLATVTPTACERLRSQTGARL